MEKIKLNQLEMLVAAANAGSFSAAAADLGCTQSRISHGVAELEQCVGAKLLERSRSGCVPTDAGRKALVAARQMLKIAEDIARPARTVVTLEGKVQIACLCSTATHLLPHVIEALANQCPGIHVEINDSCRDYHEIVANVEQGLSDIGITRGPVGEHLVSHPFVRDDYVAIVPTSAELESPVCLERLARLPFIQLQQPGAVWILEQCRAAGLACPPSRRLANVSGVLAFVSQGLGFALLPRLVAFPGGPGTKALKLPFTASRHHVVITRPALAETRLISTVVQFILDRRFVMKTDAWRAGVVGL